MSSHEQGQERPSIKWLFVEFWVEPVLNTPDVLELICRKSDLYEILDPSRNYEVVFSTSDYDEATYWLAEDEYERVTGKIVNPLIEE